MITETYTNKDETVYKFIHDSGAESTIKTVPSCVNNIVNKNLTIEKHDRNKASVFISMSVGCSQKCGICYLTTKRFHYHPLTDHEIIENTIDAIKSVDIKDKYLKLSFMGMGEPFTAKNNIYEIVVGIITYVISNKLVKGLDGVDIGTSFPKKKFRNPDIYGIIGQLVDWIDENDFKMNPYHVYSVLPEMNRNSIRRTPVRLFVSLHGTTDNKRKLLIPNTEDLFNILLILSTNLNFIDILFHYVFIDGINDSDSDVDKLIEMFTGEMFKYDELRFLRYNKCSGSQYKESKRFDDIVTKLIACDMKFKYQISAGSEIKAACGQFICKN